MKFVLLIKVLLGLLVFSLTACVQQIDSSVPALKTSLNLHSWHWDDQQQHWINQGAIFDIDAKNIATMPWEHQKKAIALEIESVNWLNSFEEPPTLLMKIFQFSDSRAFLRALTSRSGLQHLLIAKQIDPACISVKHFRVSPGQTQQLILDRVAGARYIGIVLGYSDLKQTSIARLIPIVTLKTTKNINPIMPINVSATALRLNPINHRPALLTLKLSLGAESINNLAIDIK
jgi:predicted component of type VI protein secretion system